MLWTKDELKQDLRQGIYTIVFEKVNGETREMRCTLKPEYLPEIVVEEGTTPKAPKKENPDVLAVWDLEKSAWRSMRVDSIQTVMLEEENAPST